MPPGSKTFAIKGHEFGFKVRAKGAGGTHRLSENARNMQPFLTAIRVSSRRTVLPECGENAPGPLPAINGVAFTNPS